MQVQLWNSFSCNNSSDYRLVARFADAKTAEKMGAELTKFFAEYAEELDQILEDTDYEFPDEAPPKAVAFGKKYGITFKEPLSWGDEGLSGDEPQVAVAGSTLAIYHTYCGGFGADLPKLLKKAGAKVEAEEREAPDLACSFSLPPGKAGEKLAAELVAFLDQGKKFEQICDFEIEAPWTGQRLMYEEGSRVIWASDGTKFAFAMPFDITGFENLKKYLTKHKAKDVSIELGDAKARAAIEKLAKASAPTAAATSAPQAVAIDPKGKKFLFTGKLATMTRDEAKKRVAALGGVSAGSVSKDLDVLVIGDDGSPLYGAGTKGDKQRAAEKLIAAGSKLQIISENAFLSLKKK
ncbi:MAG: BRCT domain-containing protein [Kofleriaceae bacterium]